MKPEKRTISIAKLLPWGAGAGFAVGQMTLSSQCTLVVIGQCSGCAGCMIALGSLVAWAGFKQDDTQAADDHHCE